MDTANINSLSVSEKLRLVTQLWDDIAASGEELFVPPDIVAETQRRSEEIRANPSIAIDDDTLWRRVNG